MGTESIPLERTLIRMRLANWLPIQKSRQSSCRNLPRQKFPLLHWPLGQWIGLSANPAFLTAQFLVPSLPCTLCHVWSLLPDPSSVPRSSLHLHPFPHRLAPTFRLPTRWSSCSSSPPSLPCSAPRHACIYTYMLH